MIDTSITRWLPFLGRRTAESRRATGSRVSRLAAQYDADVDAALQRLWPKAKIYHDREFTRDRADLMLVIRGRGVMVETKVKSDPGVFRGSTLPPLLDRLQRDGRRLVVILNQGDPAPARDLITTKLGDKGQIVVWSGPHHDADLREAVETLLHQTTRHA
jgi:hypothetical protein